MFPRKTEVCVPVVSAEEKQSLATLCFRLGDVVRNRRVEDKHPG